MGGKRTGTHAVKHTRRQYYRKWYIANGRKRKGDLQDTAPHKLRIGKYEGWRLFLQMLTSLWKVHPNFEITDKHKDAIGAYIRTRLIGDRRL